MIMVVKKNKEEGQALIEFVLFLPFMIMMYMAILTIGNSINGSINQQKITRGYFYYRIGNNSTIPRPRRQSDEPSDGWQVFGMQILGWAENFDVDRPISPCFQFNIPFEGDEEGCEDNYSERRTQFIRTQTVYGVCGATYVKDPDSRQNIRQPDGSSLNSANSVVSPDACSIIEG